MTLIGRFRRSAVLIIAFHFQRVVKGPSGRVSLHSGGVGKLLGYARVSTLEQNADRKLMR